LNLKDKATGFGLQGLFGLTGVTQLWCTSSSHHNHC